MHNQDIQNLKKIRNYFGENSSSIFEQMAFEWVDSIIKNNGCSHVDTYPLNRFGDSKCNNCGTIIKDSE